MEINFRNINVNSQNIKNQPAKPDSGAENFSAKGQAVNGSGQMQSYTVSMFNLHFNVLTKMQQSVLIRDLLNLPKEIGELLALLTFSNSINPEMAKQANELNQLILMADIQNILNANSKELLNKLLKLIQPTPGNIQNFDQLKEIINTIQKFIPGQNATNNEILKNVVLLYLPWLPLTQPQDISIEYEKKQLDEEKEDVTLVIYITTENIGRLKSIIKLDKNFNLKILIESLNYDESIKEYIQLIDKKVNEEIKSSKIPAKTEINSYKLKELNKSERREVSVQSGSSSISPKILMAAYIVTKVIFELDESITLKKKRKNMVQE